MHIFGGLALGLGLAMRDFFSNALIYFVLRINAPFSKNDLLAVRPRYGELYIGQVVGMDFLHTKLATLTDTGNQVGESFQFVQNKLLMSKFGYCQKFHGTLEQKYFDYTFEILGSE